MGVGAVGVVRIHILGLAGKGVAHGVDAVADEVVVGTNLESVVFFHLAAIGIYIGRKVAVLKALHVGIAVEEGDRSFTQPRVAVVLGEA